MTICETFSTLTERSVSRPGSVLSASSRGFVTLRSMHGWLRDTQADYYDRYRFADVFASARRAPLMVAEQLAAIPGVAAVAPRVVLADGPPSLPQSSAV